MNNFNQFVQRKSKVKYLVIAPDEADQRIDNFLIRKLKSVPKSHIYRLIRKGEVRVNKKRISPFYRILPGDSIRLPPVLIDNEAKAVPASDSTKELLAKRILYEDENLMVINKPPGMSVHAGSTVRIGVIEALRQLYPKLIHLELAHRLDSETSGCLILAKKKRILRELHSMLREGKITKIYWALTKGKWKASELRVDVSLHKDYRHGGKHIVEVRHDKGKSALTVFHPIKTGKIASLVEVELFTGRTHQIRVHASYQGHPILGDTRYGDAEFNKLVQKSANKRMALHAKSVKFTLPSLGQHISVSAPLDPQFKEMIKKLVDDKEIG